MTCLTWDMGLPPRTDDYDGELRYEYDTSKVFMRVNGSWQELVEIPDGMTRKYPTVCPNCGTPHNPNIDYCEHCGTFFE